MIAATEAIGPMHMATVHNLGSIEVGVEVGFNDTVPVFGMCFHQDLIEAVEDAAGDMHMGHALNHDLYDVAGDSHMVYDHRHDPDRRDCPDADIRGLDLGPRVSLDRHRPGSEGRARTPRRTRLRAVHRAWEVANGHYDPDPVALLYDILGGPLVSHPVFAPAYFAEGREAAIQAVINRYGLYAVEIRTLRDLVERTIRRA